MIIRRFNVVLILGFLLKMNSFGSDIKEVVPLTNKILLVYFDDGTVTYPNTLKVDRLNVTNADLQASWSYSSSDDSDFAVPIHPVLAGRKSKGTEFIKDPTWGGQSFDPRSKPWASEHWIYLVFDKEMKHGKSYSLKTGTLAKNGSEWNLVFDEKELRSEAVHVNTLGYSAQSPKFGYVYQWMGNLGNLDLTPYSGKKFWIYKDGNAEPLKEGTLRKRKSAGNAETSQTNDTPNKNFLGTEVYECDFSDVTSEGKYKLVVEDMGCSYPFKIGKDAVWEAYYNVARALYHQRSGIRLAPPYIASGYIRPVNQNTRVTSDDGTSFAGKLLYSDYPFMDWAEGDGGGSSQAAIRAAAEGKTLDVAGWYHDAGDWDSYYSHQRIPMMLMATWEFAPDRFADDELNIPESGNGIPDLIDEASWLIKFNYRLRKELKNKSYSNGGVGGARVCADVYTAIDGSAENNLPSWKESRRTVVTKADAFMTYLFAGEAAQFGCILKRLGRDPKNFEVEMLDAVEFSQMSKDHVNWIAEAEEAYAWAAAPENQPAKGTNYDSPLTVYKMYAAVNLFRLTGKEEYHAAAKNELTKLQNSGSVTGDNRWGVYSYLLSKNQKTDKNLQANLKNAVINTADADGIASADSRACRWGGNFSFPMLIGQGTTPMVFETLIAACVSGEKKYEDLVHTTADYFLGSNPLHTTWITGVGPRPAACGFHLDSRYNNNWVTYPGWIPYGPWSMAYGFTPYTWVIDGVSLQGGHGPWNKDWANFSMFPSMENWPGHERWNSNIHSPLSAENTIHQNSVYGAVTYGFVNSRHYENGLADVKIGSVELNKTSLELTSAGMQEELAATADVSNATIAALKWISSDPRIASVDETGRVTGVTRGVCTITCSTLDGSVSATCNVTCNWQEISVNSITLVPAELTLFKGQTRVLNVRFDPVNATNQFVDYSYSVPGIVKIDENGRLTALEKGTVVITATSLNGGKKASCEVTIKELVDYVIADFDEVIPVTTEPQPHAAQLYTPNGSNDIAFNNPMINTANPGNKVVKWNRIEGDWQLIGIVLPTLNNPDLSQFSQFQFKYYGKEIKDFYVQLIGKNGTMDFNQNAQGEDCWKLFTCDLTSVDSLKQFNVFVNKTGNPKAITCYFDDFKLAGSSSVWYDGLMISDASVKIKQGGSYQLAAEAQGNPFSWVSENPEIATVDQSGKITAVSRGVTNIKAVPLYGEVAECSVTVEGGTTSGYQEEVFLDFENIELDWSGGYGAFSWNTDQQLKTENPSVNTDNPSAKVYKWTRDIAGNNKWGGYGIVLPAKNTNGWERISFQVLVSAPVSTIRMELFQGETSLGSFIHPNLDIQASKWTAVSFSLADLGMINKTFDKFQLQIGGGADLPLLTTWSDNFKFEKGTLVAVPEFLASKNLVRVFPVPAKNLLNVECINGLDDIEIYDLSGTKLFQKKFGGEQSVSLSKSLIGSGLFIAKITDTKGNSQMRKIVFDCLSGE